jgi:hypothetical protein
MSLFIGKYKDNQGNIHQLITTESHSYQNLIGREYVLSNTPTKMSIFFGQIDSHLFFCAIAQSKDECEVIVRNSQRNQCIFVFIEMSYYLAPIIEKVNNIKIKKTFKSKLVKLYQIDQEEIGDASLTIVYNKV